MILQTLIGSSLILAILAILYGFSVLHVWAVKTNRVWLAVAAVAIPTVGPMVLGFGWYLGGEIIKFWGLK